MTKLSLYQTHCSNIWVISSFFGKLHLIIERFAVKVQNLQREFHNKTTDKTSDVHWWKCLHTQNVSNMSSSFTVNLANMCVDSCINKLIKNFPPQQHLIYFVMFMHPADEFLIKHVFTPGVFNRVVNVRSVQSFEIAKKKFHMFRCKVDTSV